MIAEWEEQSYVMTKAVFLKVRQGCDIWTIATLLYSMYMPLYIFVI